MSFQAEEEKTEFIDFEANEEFNQGEDLIFLDDGNDGKITDNFINGSEEINENEPRFYRKFANQTKDPKVAIYEESDIEHFLDTRDFMQ